MTQISPIRKGRLPQTCELFPQKCPKNRRKPENPKISSRKHANFPPENAPKLPDFSHVCGRLFPKFPHVLSMFSHVRGTKMTPFFRFLPKIPQKWCKKIPQNSAKKLRVSARITHLLGGGAPGPARDRIFFRMFAGEGPFFLQKPPILGRKIPQNGPKPPKTPQNGLKTLKKP